MNNKKGFTLIELLVSFVLITSVSVALFRTVVSLQQKQQINIAKNKYKAFTTVLNNTLQKDFLTNKIISMKECETNCYNITYENGETKTLLVDRENNTITYGTSKQELPNDYIFYDNMSARYYDNPNTDGLNSFVIISIPIKSNLDPDLDEVKYMYQYDNAVDVIDMDVELPEYGVGTTYLEQLYDSAKLRSRNGLIKDDTDDKNLRYSGSTPNNYVEFNDELWRIIGVFDVKENESSTAVPRIKLIRNESIGNFSWDSSENSVNNGAGVNEWSVADLNILLNNTYYNKTTSDTCYNGWNNASTNCDFTSTGLGSTAKSMITSTVWNTGGVTVSEGTVAKNSYTAERGTGTGKICTNESASSYYDGIYCTDEVTRTTSYTDEIGLIYPSDYLYASKDANCRTNGRSESYYCKNDNWLHTGYQYWVLSPRASYEYSNFSLVIYSLGSIAGHDAGTINTVHPSVYLKSTIKIVDGSGTELDPYQLSL